MLRFLLIVRRVAFTRALQRRAGTHELGRLLKGLRHRHRKLPELWWYLEDHRILGL